MIIYNWLIFKDVTLRLKPIGMMNGRDVNATVENIITNQRVQMNGLLHPILQMMELQVMEVEIHLDHFNIFRIYVLSNF
jgi:hypothetical protein